MQITMPVLFCYCGVEWEHCGSYEGHPLLNQTVEFSNRSENAPLFCLKVFSAFEHLCGSQPGNQGYSSKFEYGAIQIRLTSGSRKNFSANGWPLL